MEYLLVLIFVGEMVFKYRARIYEDDEKLYGCAHNYCIDEKLTRFSSSFLLSFNLTLIIFELLIKKTYRP